MAKAFVKIHGSDKLLEAERIRDRRMNQHLDVC